MNRKGKNNIKNHLTSIINKKSINEHYHEQKGLIDYKNIEQTYSLNISHLPRNTHSSNTHNSNTHTSNIHHSNTQNTHNNIKKRKIEQEYNRLLEMVDRYERYYKRLLQQQKDNYVKYSKQIVDMIRSEFNKGKEQLQQKIKAMSSIFSSHRDKIFYFLKEIQHNESHIEDLYDIKLNQFKNLEIIDLQFVEILPINIQHLQQQFHQYKFNFYQPSLKQQYSLQTNHSLSLKQSFRSVNDLPNSTKQQSSQTQSRALSQPEGYPQQQIDNLLGCDEQIGQKVSQSSKKRRKYQVGRQNIIKEQDESQQNNSILSES